MNEDGKIRGRRLWKFCLHVLRGSAWPTSLIRQKRRGLSTAPSLRLPPSAPTAHKSRGELHRYARLGLSTYGLLTVGGFLVMHKHSIYFGKYGMKCMLPQNSVPTRRSRG